MFFRIVKLTLIVAKLVFQYMSPLFCSSGFLKIESGFAGFTVSWQNKTFSLFFLSFLTVMPTRSYEWLFSFFFPANLLFPISMLIFLFYLDCYISFLFVSLFFIWTIVFHFIGVSSSHSFNLSFSIPFLWLQFNFGFQI